MDIFGRSDSYIVCYAFPGCVAHSSYVIPYSQHHIQDKKKNLKKIATKAELQRYCNIQNPNNGKSTWMNFWIRHTRAISEMHSANCMCHIIIDAHMMSKGMEAQTHLSTTIGYLLGIDAKTMD